MSSLAILLPLLLLLMPVPASPANIFMYLPAAARSYMSVWAPLVHGLAEAGHNVTFVTRFSILPHPNLTQVVSECPDMDQLEKDQCVASMKESSAFSILRLFPTILRASSVISEAHENALRKAQPLLKKKWDLVITSTVFNEAGVMLGHHFDTPVIVLLATNADQFQSLSLGHSDNPAWSGYNSDILFNRISILFLNLIYELLLKPIYLVAPQTEVMKKLVNFSMADEYWKLERNIDFSFYVSSPLFGEHSPRLPNSRQVAFIHCREGGELPEDLMQFIENHDEVIYMSLGSLFRSELMPEETKDMFVEVFKTLKQGVIWKLDEDIDSPNIFTRRWLPQQDILAQPKVKLFISQCGLMSIQEAIYHNVPVLCLPLSFDQHKNSHHAEFLMLGREFNFFQMNIETLPKAISSVLEDEEIYSNMSKLSQLAKDRKISPLEESIWWVHYVLRHKGADKLKSSYRYLALHQFYLLDVILLTLSVLFLSVLILMVISKRIVLFTLGPRRVQQVPAANGPVPAPAGDEPEADRPVPVTDRLEVGVPEPANDGPEPANDGPEPANDGPEPANDGPEPAEDAPEPAEDAPEPAEDAPEPAEDGL